MNSSLPQAPLKSQTNLRNLKYGNSWALEYRISSAYLLFVALSLDTIELRSEVIQYMNHKYWT